MALMDMRSIEHDGIASLGALSDNMLWRMGIWVITMDDKYTGGYCPSRRNTVSQDSPNSVYFLIFLTLFLAATRICYARAREYPTTVDNYPEAAYCMT
jgi:hypothetical protein